MSPSNRVRSGVVSNANVPLLMPMYSPFDALLTPMPFAEGGDTIAESHGFLAGGCSEENPMSHAVVKEAVTKRVNRVITTLLYFCNHARGGSAWLITNQPTNSKKFFVKSLCLLFISMDFCIDLSESNLVSPG